LQICACSNHRCANVHQIGFGKLDLSQLAASFQVRKLLIGLIELMRRLIARGALVAIVLGQQNCPGRDLVAARR
jgi:hypothetical protein